MNAPLPMSAAPSSTLAELQQRMQAHVLQEDADAAGALSAALSCAVVSPALADVADDVAELGDSKRIGPARRLGIYHHAYRARLLETMRDTFGHTLSYLGDEWFDHLALRFIAHHPSEHANLRWYGQRWPAWLAQGLSEGGVLSEQLGVHPEVAELAALDWALRRAFDAADAPVLDAAHLATLPAQDWTAEPLQAQAAMQMLTVRCNSLALWHALDQDQDVPPAEVLPSPVDVLVWRLEERPHFRSVAALEARALHGLARGASFEAICADLAEAQPDQDAAPLAAGFLRRWLDEGLLAASAA